VAAAMSTAVRLLVPVMASERIGDPPHAGHHHGALDPGGHGREGLQVHPPRVPKLPTNWSREPREVVRMACHAGARVRTDLLVIRNPPVQVRWLMAGRPSHSGCRPISQTLVRTGKG